MTDSILQRGLLPLSAFPESEVWQRVASFYKSLYGMMAEPTLKRPYNNSGVFLTPIDFRLMPGSMLAKRVRIAIPVNEIEAATAIVTFELDGQRVVEPLSEAALERAAALWPGDKVQEWFAKDQTKMFFYVPQVAAYPEGGLLIRPEWIEPAPSSTGGLHHA